MNRALYSLRRAALALLAAGALAGAATAQRLQVGSVDAQFGQELRLSLVVADGATALPGVRVQPLRGENAEPFVTDELGSLVLPIGESATALDLRIVDADGNSWILEQAFEAGSLPPQDAVLVLQGQEALLVPAEYGPAGLAAHHAWVAELQSGLVAPDVDPDSVMDVELERADAPLARITDGRVERSALPRDRQDSAARRGGSGGGLQVFEPGRDLDASWDALWTGETEPNNTTDQCNPLEADNLGVELSGQDLSGYSDYDFYCIELQCGDQLTATATPVDGTLSPWVAIYWDNGVPAGVLLNQDSGSYSELGEPTSLTVTAHATGTYYVRIRRGSGSGSAPWGYTMQYDVTPGECPFDAGAPGGDDQADDAIDACVPSFVPATYERVITWAGTLSTARDFDTYCVSLDCGQGLRVTMTPHDAELDPQIKIYAPGSTSAYTQPSGDPGEPLVVEIAPVADGGLWAVQMTSSGPTTGAYEVSFEYFEAYDCIDQYEPNDERVECSPITPGELQEHVMYPNINPDWACFDVPECGTWVTVQTRLPPGVYNVDYTDTAETTISVWGPDGNPVKGELSGGDISQAAVTFVATEPGTYAVRVLGTHNEPATASDVITGRYDLLVTFKDGKEPLLVPVTETELPGTTQLDAEVLAEVSMGGLVVPGPGAVDMFPDGNNMDPVGLPFGFDFEFYGEPQTELRVGDDGYLVFGPPTSGFESSNAYGECLPNAFTPNGAVYAFWAELETRINYAGDPTTYIPTARKTWEVVGAAPDRQFIATWYRMPGSAGQQGNLAGEHSFSVTLHEGSDCIDITYGEMSGWNGSEGQSAVVGLENSTATDAIMYSCFEAKVESGLKVTFCPDGSGGYTMTEGRAGDELVPYPTDGSCAYEITADSAPFMDISGTGELVEDWVREYAVPGPSPWGPPLGYATDPDENHALVTLPFPFPYHGVVETDVMIFINGFLSFDPVMPHPNANTRSNRCDQPEQDDFNGKVMVFWDDLAFGETGFFPNLEFDGGVYTELVDPSAAPGDAMFIVQWERATIPEPCIFAPCPLAGPDRTLSFQAILHESGDIEFRYGDMGGLDPYTHATGYSATVGLEDGTGTRGSQYWCNSSGSNYGANRFQGPLVQDHRVLFQAASGAPQFEWTDFDSGAVLGTDPTLVVDASATGPCQVQLQVTARDPEQCCEQVSTQVIPTDRVAPEIGEASLEPNCLWSPNHKTVTLGVGTDIVIEAIDNCSGSVVNLVSCTSNEPDNGLGDGNTEDDCVLLSDQTVRLRSERSGLGLGRTYTIGFELVDIGGNVATGELDVFVPHDQSGVDCPRLTDLRRD